MQFAMQWRLVFFIFSSVFGNAFADDTELYVYKSSTRIGERSQVLIIFDNSGSMDKKEENTEAFYPRGDTIENQTRLYYSLSSSDVPKFGDPRSFLQAVNGCATSISYLKKYGMFTGFIRDYQFSGQTGTWKELGNNGLSIELIDCFEDIEARNPINIEKMSNGYPVDSLGSLTNVKPYTLISSSATEEDINSALEKAYLTGFGTGKAITLYTEKYIKWHHNLNKGVEDYSRLQIAKRVIEDIVVTTPSVNFGLAVFNRNYNDIGSFDGGRIVSGIKPMTDKNKTDLLSKINSLEPDTNTPLCETLYEARQYFSGESPVFGNKDDTATPSRDDSIEKNGRYVTPYKACQNLAFVVYITDGLPIKDKAADDKVKNLSGSNKTAFKWQVGRQWKYSFLPNLSEWMYLHDVNTDLIGQQTVKTFTIGFSSGAGDAAPVLKETARLGGGKYFAAYNAIQLQEALQQVFSEIMEVNASFTSPSIASNNSDPTQTDESVYYAMFLPNKGPRWAGNLKKFKVNQQGDIVDYKNNLVINSDGDIDKTACSIWTNCSNGTDGNEVLVGGVAQALQAMPNRKIYGNFGVDSSLVDFTVALASEKAQQESISANYADLASYMKVDKTQLDSLFNWARGIDVDDDDGDKSVTDKRVDIIGDPLHSKPLAINFGTNKNPDVRIVMGTNHGMLHMFKDAGSFVSESWAFIPYEFLPHLKDLRANIPTGVHSVYGLDTPPVAHITYKLANNKEKVIDKVWLFIGMRRGGNSYYALDISLPDTPKFLWKIDASSSGMEELGQSWSEPVVTYIPHHIDNKVQKPKAVLIFGGGYSPTEKDGALVPDANPDVKGKAVFIIDAQTGELVHKFDGKGGTKATKIPNIKDSIPNKVAILDSNNDGLTDRIYATDTGANIWRMDLPSTARSTWSAFKFAELGGNTPETDIRFFAEPVIAQTKANGTPYDAVVVGSGHRAHPLNLERKDMFFMLQDKYVVTQSYKTAPPATITLNKLKDISLTSNVAIPENTQDGWVYKFKTQGEKSLSGASIIKGRVFFTSYVPGDTSTSNNQCLAQGEGRMYGFDLHSGKRAVVEKGQHHENPDKDYISLGSRVPDTPQVVIPNGEKIYFVGIGNAGEIMDKVVKNHGCDPDDNKCISGGLSTNKIYHYISENH